MDRYMFPGQIVTIEDTTNGEKIKGVIIEKSLYDKSMNKKWKWFKDDIYKITIYAFNENLKGYLLINKNQYIFEYENKRYLVY